MLKRTTAVSFDSNELVISVSDLNRLVRLALEKGLPSCRVRGEISNFNRASSGHWYFTLKDDQASARCVMFRTRNQFVDWAPHDGDQAELRVQPTLYEQRGDFQLVVEAMRKAGQGSLFEAFLRLKNKLEAEGLFSQDRKRPIPRFPRSIGIVTSEQAAALRDVLSTISVRWPSCKIILYATPVQGDAAVKGLIEAIVAAGQRSECEVLLLVRGGGSMEDFRGFNDESVARTIATCPIPIVAGVGHETDFTIADFVADLRAPTPTGAAQLVTPSRADIRKHIQHLNTRRDQILESRLQTLSQLLDGLRKRVTHPHERIALKRQQLSFLSRRLCISVKAVIDVSTACFQQCKRIHPMHWENTQSLRQNVTALEKRLHSTLSRMIEDKTEFIRMIQSHLELLSPASVLHRGYSIVRSDAGEVIRFSGGVRVGQRIGITLAQGELIAEVVGIEDSQN